MATELKPVYLITGGDRPKIQRALRRLRDRIGDDAAELLSANEIGGDDAVAACNSMGLLGGGRRLVIVEDVECWKAADAKSSPPTSPARHPTPCWHSSRRRSRRIQRSRRRAPRRERSSSTTSPKRRLPEWVKKQFADRGVEADAEAARLLVEIVGEDPEELATEVDKIATWAAGEPVGPREIELLGAGAAEVPGYELTDAWGRRTSRQR